jgi:hypothetical protein
MINKRTTEMMRRERRKKDRERRAARIKTLKAKQKALEELLLVRQAEQQFKAARQIAERLRTLKQQIIYMGGGD